MSLPLTDPLLLRRGSFWTETRLASRNTHPWDVSRTKPENAISRFFIFKDLSSLKMLAHPCAKLVPAVSGRTLIKPKRKKKALHFQQVNNKV